MLFPKITATWTQALYRRIVLRGGGPPKRSTVAPFLDIMALGTVQQKRVVIAMIADKFHPAFAPALQSARTIPNRRSASRPPLPWRVHRKRLSQPFHDTAGETCGKPRRRRGHA